MTALANHLWQSTMVLVVIWALARALRHHRAAARHALWLAATVKFLLPFDALFGFGRQFGFGVPGITSTPLARAVEIASDPFSHSALTVAAAIVTAPGADVPTTVFPTGTVLFVAWAIGFSVAAAAWLRNWVRLAALARHSHAQGPSPVAAALRRAETAQRHRRVTLVECASRIEPGIFGIWRPTLLWPHDLKSRLSTAEIDAVIAHELCHVRRRDNLTQAVHALVHAIFWFYPVIRLIGARLHMEREHACDEDVLGRGCPPHIYAESIVKTCEFCIPTHAMAAGATGSLRSRVVGILHGQVGAVMGRGQRIALGLTAVAVIVVPVVFGTLSAPHLRAQAPAAAGDLPAFEVASVKPNTSTSTARMFQAMPGGRVNLVNLSLRELIFRAYQTQDHLLVGAPEWINDERFDVVAKAAGNTSPPQMLLMVRTLLADRFSLVMHREIREMPIYSLVAARRDKRPGPSLKATTCVPGTPGAPMPDTRDGQGRFQCGVNRFGPGQILLTGNTLDALANRLGSLAAVNRSVVNHTGIDGQFDMELSFTADAGTSSSDAVSLFTAIQDQLGLKLEPSRGPVEVLVIDHVERPMPD